MKPARSTLISILICSGLAACCAAIYGQTLSHGFLTYDDGLYVTDNVRVKAGLSWGNLLWALTTQKALYVHPLTWISHMLDCELYGLKPWGHHLTNLVFHTLNAILLFLVLRRMSGRWWPSALAAALFAVHPLHVESVAWIAERKDVLSTFFWMGALWAYAWHRDRPGPVRYLAVAFMFLMGLMSKPMVVTLPFALLLLDYWPLNGADRAGSVGDMTRRMGRLALEKAPLFLITALFCGITLAMQIRGNNLAFGEKVPFAARCANAVVVYVLYLVKTVWPSGLAVYYPHPIMRPMGQVAVSAAVLAAVTLFCLRHVRRHPYLIVGWFWYLGTLVPVIELVQAGTFSHADRYTYIPLIGVFVMIAWGLDHLRSAGGLRSGAVTVGAALAVAALTLTAFHQTGYWKDSITLFRHDLDVAGGNAVAHHNIGVALVDSGRLNEAAEQFDLALKANPKDAEALYNLGVIMESLNRPAEAESYYRQALQWQPAHPKAHNNLGGILVNARRLDEAMSHFRTAVDVAPDLVDARNNLGNLLAGQGKLEEAMQEYGRALELDPGQTSVRLNLASILNHLGRREEAFRQLDTVLQLEPGNKIARQMREQMEKAQAVSSGAGANTQ
jgi:Flp pilus assembly protein TadD